MKRFLTFLRSCATSPSAVRGSLHEDRERTPLRPRALRRFFLGSFAALLLTSAGFAAALENDQVIVPKAAPAKSDADAPARPSSGSSSLTLVAVLVLGCAGGWMLWRNRQGGSLMNLRPGARAPRNLAVEETRSLGNRQYLVVASYQDKKFLLGVCQGRIDLLSSLNDASPAPEKPRA